MAVIHELWSDWMKECDSCLTVDECWCGCGSSEITWRSKVCCVVSLFPANGGRGRGVDQLAALPLGFPALGKPDLICQWDGWRVRILISSWAIIIILTSFGRDCNLRLCVCMHSITQAVKIPMSRL